MKKTISKNKVLHSLLMLGVTIPAVFSTNSAFSQVAVTPLELYYNGYQLKAGHLWLEKWDELKILHQPFFCRG